MDLRVLLDWVVTEKALEIACWGIEGYSTKKRGAWITFSSKVMHIYVGWPKIATWPKMGTPPSY